MKLIKEYTIEEFPKLTIEEFLKDYPEFDSGTFFFSEFYKNVVTYTSVKDNKKFILSFLLEYRDDIPPYKNINTLKYEESLNLSVYSLSKTEVKNFQEEYEKELIALKIKYGRI